jgi:UDP-glucose 4-epimerase
MKVVVTGASGSVGTALLRAARNENWEVVGVARRRPDTARQPYSSADWMQCDLGAPDAVHRLSEALEGAQVVVHLAWAIQPASDDPARRRTNVTGSTHVLQAAVNAEVPHVVAASSVAAYAPAPRWKRVGEDWPCTGVPGSAYSADKVVLERMLDEFVLHNPTVAVSRIRPCAVVQRDSGAQLERWTVSPLIPPQILGRRWLPVPLWKGLRAQAVHADDVADALRLIIRQREVGAFNLASEPVLNAPELARIFGGVLVPVPLSVLLALAWPSWRLGLQPMHPGWLKLADQVPLMDTSRARSQLGWIPRHDTRSALEEFVAAIARGCGTASDPLKSRGDGDRWSRFGWGRPVHQSQCEETS